MIKPECMNLIITKGATPTFELQFTDDDDIALDITGWTIYFTAKEKISDTDENAKINKKITTHSEALNGKTLIELTNTETNRTGNLWFSVDYKDDDGNEGCLFYGKITFLKTARSVRD